MKERKLQVQKTFQVSKDLGSLLLCLPIVFHRISPFYMLW
jgi:hypothetical protein